LTYISKKSMSAELARKFEIIFQCPICNSPMKVYETKSLICMINNHTFDFTKHGYVNFITQSIKVGYDKKLFEARRKLITESGFFDPLNETIAQIINEEHEITKNDKPLLILDAGCGEGTQLSTICDLVSEHSRITVTGAGIDISKEGILAASKSYRNQIWSVSDLANTPFQDSQFNIILNVLSPSNYSEFDRLLKKNGLVIKIVPKRDYLLELRQFFYNDMNKKPYSSEKIINLFNKNYRSVQNINLRYVKSLDKSAIPLLIQMTPLSWGCSMEQIHLFIEAGITDITVDLEILIGRK
jgi:23S rRNA (guanine745-N1)-methyltransferase